MELATTRKCGRPGCTFERGQRRRANGTLTPWCGAACYTWTSRARHASRIGDSAEAAELLRVADLLDERSNPREWVPGVFLEDAPRP